MEGCHYDGPNNSEQSSSSASPLLPPHLNDLVYMLQQMEQRIQPLDYKGYEGVFNVLMLMGPGSITADLAFSFIHDSLDAYKSPQFHALNENPTFETLKTHFEM